MALKSFLSQKSKILICMGLQLAAIPTWATLCDQSQVSKLLERFAARHREFDVTSLQFQILDRSLTDIEATIVQKIEGPVETFLDRLIANSKGSPVSDVTKQQVEELVYPEIARVTKLRFMAHLMGSLFLSLQKTAVDPIAESLNSQRNLYIADAAVKLQAMMADFSRGLDKYLLTGKSLREEVFDVGPVLKAAVEGRYGDVYQLPDVTLISQELDAVTTQLQTKLGESAHEILILVYQAKTLHRGTSDGFTGFISPSKITNDLDSDILFLIYSVNELKVRALRGKYHSVRIISERLYKTLGRTLSLEKALLTLKVVSKDLKNHPDFLPNLLKHIQGLQQRLEPDMKSRDFFDEEIVVRNAINDFYAQLKVLELLLGRGEVDQVVQRISYRQRAGQITLNYLEEFEEIKNPVNQIGITPAKVRKFLSLFGVLGAGTAGATAGVYYFDEIKEFFFSHIE